MKNKSQKKIFLFRVMTQSSTVVPKLKMFGQKLLHSKNSVTGRDGEYVSDT